MTRKIPEDAFELYVSLGPERSYAAVAEQYGVTKRAVVKRAKAEAWSERLAKIEDQAHGRRPTPSSAKRSATCASGTSRRSGS